MKRLFVVFAVALAVFVADPAPPRADAQAGLTWTPCGTGFECTTLQVPVDYSQPGGPNLGLALARLPAQDPAKRIGSLLVNPGGPGASGVEFVKLWARTLDQSIRDRFDIVGFDPRGVGTSDPIVCHSNLQAYVAADPSPDSEAEWDTLRDETGEMADECADKYASLLPHLGTKDVARDLDRIRAAVGDDKLTYLGYSYGTSIGQVYAEMFPGKIRAIVLDGAVDLSLSDDERSLTQAAGFETALQSFLNDCRKTRCVLTKQGDPQKAVDDLFAKTEAAPIPAPGRDRPAGPGETMLAVLEPLYAKQAWPILATAIDRGLGGDGSLLVTLADAYLQRKPDGSYPNIVEANTAVNCIDEGSGGLPAAYADYPAAAARFAAVSPHFGPAFATGLGCYDWKAKPDPLSPPTADGAPPILVVSTTADPATPYEWGVAVSQQLGTGVLLTYRGDGHTAYGGKDECVDDTVNAYLLTLALPKGGAVCGNGPDVPAQDGRPPATSRPGQAGSPAPAPDINTAVLRSLVVLGGVLLVACAVVVALRSIRE